MNADVVIIGGGLSGIAAATQLAQNGARVTLLEKKPFLGGRTYSIRDPHSGAMIDNGQHALMACYHETFSLLRQLGTDDCVQVQKSLTIPYRGANGFHDSLRCPPLPGPFHLLAGMIRMRSFGIRDVWNAARFGWAIRKYQPCNPRETTEQFCARLKQPEQLNELMWRPITLSTLNESFEQADAASLATVLQQAFLGAAKDSNMALAITPLQDLHGDKAIQYIEERKGTVRLGARVEKLKFLGERITGVQLKSGEIIPSGAVISAIPANNLSELLDNSGLNDRITIPDLGESPILCVYLWYKNPIADEDFCCLTGTTFEWAFHRSNFMKSNESGKNCVCLLVSAAHHLLNRTRAELIQIAINDLREAYPSIQNTVPQSAAVFWERRATFSLTPKNAVQRPPHTTAIKNLYLAGDWTNTGLPATMEGAVLSGHRCASIIKHD